MLERPACHAQQRFDDDRQHCRLDAEEEGRNQRHLAESGIDHRQNEDDERAGQHKERAGGEPTAPAMQRPAGIGGKLHRFRPRQQHAEIERRQIALSRSSISSHRRARDASARSGRPARQRTGGRSSPRSRGPRRRSVDCRSTHRMPGSGLRLVGRPIMRLLGRVAAPAVESVIEQHAGFELL